MLNWRNDFALLKTRCYCPGWEGGGRGAQKLYFLGAVTHNQTVVARTHAPSGSGLLRMWPMSWLGLFQGHPARDPHEDFKEEVIEAPTLYNRFNSHPYNSCKEINITADRVNVVIFLFWLQNRPQILERMCRSRIFLDILKISFRLKSRLLYSMRRLECHFPLNLQRFMDRLSRAVAAVKRCVKRAWNSPGRPHFIFKTLYTVFT